MKDLLSSHWSSVVALAATLLLLCGILGPYEFPRAGLTWVVLVLSAGFFLPMTSTRSIRQVIDDVDGEPATAVAVPERVACVWAERSSE